MRRNERLPNRIICANLNESVKRCLPEARGDRPGERPGCAIGSIAQKVDRPAILRQSLEVLRYLGTTRRYRVRADLLLGPSIQIFPVEITETTSDVPHLSWRWWAKRFHYEIKMPYQIKDLDCAYEALREWARDLIIDSCSRAPDGAYPCGYCADKWPGRPGTWGNPANPCSVCAERYPWLLD